MTLVVHDYYLFRVFVVIRCICRLWRFDFMSKRLVVLGAVFFGVIHFTLGLYFIGASAPVYDEPIHLLSGYSYLATGKYSVDPQMHPPLARMITALPLLFFKPRPVVNAVYSANLPPWIFPDDFLYKNNTDPEKMLNAGRLLNLFTWTVLLFAGIFTWAYFLEGPAAALWSSFLLAFSPFFISNSALVTTDSAGAALFFLAFMCGWFLLRGCSLPGFSRPPALAFAAGALFSGLAMSSKINMFVIIPAGALMAAAVNLRRKLFPWAYFFRFLILLAAAAIAIVAVVYRFHEFPLYLKGALSTSRLIISGREAFALGRYSSSGFWWYFPLAFGVKTPVSVLLLFISGIIFLRREKFSLFWLLFPPAVIMAGAMKSGVNIGFRHILPVMPFVIVIAGIGAGRLWKASAVAKAAVLLLSAGLVLSVLKVHPHYLCYFNELAGGTENGYKILVDSNLDWGQGLKTLARDLEKIGNPPVYLSYLGTSDPAYYGIKYIFAAPVRPDLSIIPLNTAGDSGKWDRVLLAVSATNLQGAYYKDRNTFTWLKKRGPLFISGYSIFVYDLTSDGDGLLRLSGIFKEGGFREEAARLAARAEKLKEKN